MSTSQCHEIPGVQKKNKPSRRRPPSAKDLRIFQRAVIEEVSQRKVGEEFGVCQSAVSRKCAKVIAWMSRCGRSELTGFSVQERARYLERLAERKFEWYRQQAEAAWHQSLQPQVVIKEKGSREADDASGKFVGKVLIEKTIRPQTGKTSHLREARLALQDSVLLGWGLVGRADLELAPDPDEEARQREEDRVQAELEKKQRLERELEAARREIEALREHRPAFGAGLLTPPGGPTEGLPEAAGRPAVTHEGGVERPAPNLDIPPDGLSSRDAEEDGVRFLDEIVGVLATPETVNEYEWFYRQTLKQLWKNSHHNYEHHGIIPERQKLPKMENVRRGFPYLVYVPKEEKG